jgi:hypothetical protein
MIGLAMEKQPSKTPIKSLRDAYKIDGFHVRADIDSYEHEPLAVVMTFDRRSKKQRVASVENHARESMTLAGGACEIWHVVIERFISIFRCAA